MKTPTSNKNSEALDQIYVEGVQTSSLETRLLGEKRLQAVWGHVVLECDALGMSVVLKSISRKDDTFSPDLLLALLKESGIVHGILGEALMDVGRYLAKAEKWQGEIQIASGTPVAPTPFPRIPLLEAIGELQILENTWSVGDKDICFSKISAVLNAESLDGLEAPFPLVWIVEPQDVLAEMVKVTEGAGKDVFGEPVFHTAEGALRVGKGVEQVGNQIRSKIWGVVLIKKEEISVVPPLWISKDKMQAFYFHFPSVLPTKGPLQERIYEALKQVGANDNVINKTSQDPLNNLTKQENIPLVNLVAQGIAPINGQDACLVFEMDLSQKPGLVMEDGSIDLKERNLIHNVSAESLIVRKVVATKGQLGKTLFGDVLPTVDGQDVVLAAGDGARLGDAKFENQVVPAVFAAVDGAVVVRSGTVSVNPVFRISGDVDYETGNINFEKDVIISGSVKTGFEVRSGGQVIVGGTIEPGASVRAKGDITVGRGILGKTTRVVAMGALRAQFIQNAMVVVKGDLWCGRYIHNAQVRCGGVLKVPAGSGSKSGSIVGGMVCATKGIDVALAGSESVPGTILSIQADPEEQAKLEKITHNISVCDVQISKLTRSLGVAALDSQAIKRKLLTLSGIQRDHYVELLKKLKEVSGMRQKYESEQKELQACTQKAYKKSNIKVSKYIFARTVVKFGDVELVSEQDEQDVTFVLSDLVISRQNNQEKA